MPGVFLLWVGLAAIGTGIITLSGLSGHWQVGTFVVLAVILVGLVGWRVRRRPTPDRVNAPAVNLVGRQCRAIAFADGEGRVSLADGQWTARLSPAAPVSPGQPLRVVGLDGTVLLVTVET